MRRAEDECHAAVKTNETRRMTTIIFYMSFKNRLLSFLQVGVLIV
jgi:hypothetical protein